jgi:PhnB protein
LTVSDVVEAIEFYRVGFGATELHRYTLPDGEIIIAELSVGDARFFVAPEATEHGNLSPRTAGGTTVRLEITVPDPDAFVARATRAGASVMFPVEDRAYGWRQGRIADPFGHQWIVGRPL